MPLACPFFLPTAKSVSGDWIHPDRLPLGAGWSGLCEAPGHETALPSPEQLQHFCNLGYAARCRRLPADRAWDSIRFGARIIGSADGKLPELIQIRYVCERDHLPSESGYLDYDIASRRFEQKHPDPRLQRMAEAFLESWTEKWNRKN